MSGVVLRREVHVLTSIEEFEVAVVQLGQPHLLTQAVMPRRAILAPPCAIERAVAHPHPGADRLEVASDGGHVGLPMGEDRAGGALLPRVEGDRLADADCVTQRSL